MGALPCVWLFTRPHRPPRPLQPPTPPTHPTLPPAHPSHLPAPIESIRDITGTEKTLKPAAFK